MSYIKLRGSQIFTGSRLLSGDEVLIVEEDGRVEGIVAAADAGDDIVGMEGIISPGFVNCHCHLELSGMKGLIPEHTGMVDFLLGVMRKRQLSEDVIAAAMADADKAMYNNGIVAVGDIANTTLSIPTKRHSAIYYHSFIELIGMNPDLAGQQLTRGNGIIQEFENNGLTASLAPHAPYSVSGALLQGINKATASGIVTMHNQESPEENSLFLDKSGDFLRLLRALQLEDHFQATGKHSLPSWLPYFNQLQQVLLVHNVATAPSDLVFINAILSQEPMLLKAVYYCLCPLANAYIQQVYPNPTAFIQTGCNMVLGTDSLASNHELNIWKEINAIRLHYPAISLETMLGWATINGAKALNIDARFGSFEAGKRPGVVLLNGTHVKRLY